jgi:hypothetical protein
VLAAYNRGRHIVPTLQSILGQSFQDFELIVVGDCCTDDTERVVKACRSERIRWLNLPQRSGSQAGPNNAGIGMARGRYVAYIGHDDVWTPDHLASLHRCFEERPQAAFAIAGCIYYGPPGSGFYQVTGLFDPADGQAPRQHFFPPSSIAHRREVTDKIGPWARSEEVRAPVDAEFALRAVDAGLCFHPSGQVTVHKFAGGHRYLSYLQMESGEQIQLMRMMLEPGFPSFVSTIVERSRETGRYMIARHPDYSRYVPGELSAENRRIKGILRPPLQPLTAATRFEQSDVPAALDWQTVKQERDRTYRWSGPNPRPRLLLPFASRRKVNARFRLLGASEHALDLLRVRVNGETIAVRVKPRPGNAGASTLRCRIRLRGADYSIVEFDLTGGAALDALMREVAGVPHRIALSSVSLAPRSWLSSIWPIRSAGVTAAAQSATLA